MEGIKQTFQRCKAQNRVCSSICTPVFVRHHANIPPQQPALVTYVTAGFPTPEQTPDILLAMEKGGADVIELGVPFTDPIADGPTIQTANTVRRSAASSWRAIPL